MDTVAHYFIYFCQGKETHWWVWNLCQVGNWFQLKKLFDKTKLKILRRKFRILLWVSISYPFWTRPQDQLDNVVRLQLNIIQARDEIFKRKSERNSHEDRWPTWNKDRHVKRQTENQKLSIIINYGEVEKLSPTNEKTCHMHEAGCHKNVLNFESNLCYHITR